MSGARIPAWDDAKVSDEQLLDAAADRLDRLEVSISRNLAGLWFYRVSTERCDIRDAVESFNEALRAVLAIVRTEARRA